MNEKITVLYPIEVPEGDYCWPFLPYTGACEHFDNNGGGHRCSLGFRPIKRDDQKGFKKAPACLQLQAKAKVVVEVFGGVASVEESPDWVEVEIVDLDIKGA